MSIEFQGWDVFCNTSSCNRHEFNYGDPGDDWEDVVRELERHGWQIVDAEGECQEVYCKTCVEARAEAERLRVTGVMVGPDNTVLDVPLFDTAATA